MVSRCIKQSLGSISHLWETGIQMLSLELKHMQLIVFKLSFWWLAFYFFP